MLINVKIKKKMFFIGQTHGQLKTIVRNLTKNTSLYLSILKLTPVRFGHRFSGRGPTGCFDLAGRSSYSAAPDR